MRKPPKSALEAKNPKAPSNSSQCANFFAPKETPKQPHSPKHLDERLPTFYLPNAPSPNAT